jgi:hypothetical protein
LIAEEGMPVRRAPSPSKAVAFTVPLTSRAVVGVLVKIPTLESLVSTKRSWLVVPTSMFEVVVNAVC